MSRACYYSVVTMWRLQILLLIVVGANAKPDAGVFDPTLQAGYADYYNVRIYLPYVLTVSNCLALLTIIIQINYLSISK